MVHTVVPHLLHTLHVNVEKAQSALLRDHGDLLVAGSMLLHRRGVHEQVLPVLQEFFPIHKILELLVGDMDEPVRFPFFQHPSRVLPGEAEDIRKLFDNVCDELVLLDRGGAHQGDWLHVGLLDTVGRNDIRVVEDVRREPPEPVADNRAENGNGLLDGEVHVVV